MRGDGRGDGVGEAFTVDGQGRPGGHTARLGGAYYQGTQPPHLLFEEPDGVVDLVAAKRVTADQFGEPVGLVHGGAAHRAHLVQRNRQAR